MTESSPDVDTSSKSWPLHYKILVAMVIGTLIGVGINPGKADLSEPVTLKISRAGDSITLEELAVNSQLQSQTLVKEDFKSAADFQRSYPKLATALGDKNQLDLPVGMHSYMEHKLLQHTRTNQIHNFHHFLNILIEPIGSISPT